MTIRPIGSQAFLSGGGTQIQRSRVDTGGVRAGANDTLSEITRWQRWRGKGWRRIQKRRERDAAERSSPSFPLWRQPSAQRVRPHQPSDLLTNEWERCQSATAHRERDAPHYSRG